MTKIQSAVVMHKRMDSTDTQLMRMKGGIAHNRLEQNLGLFNFGSCHQADPNTSYTFEKVNQIWQEDIDMEESDTEDGDEDATDDDGETEPKEAQQKIVSDEEEGTADNTKTTRRSRKTHDQVRTTQKWTTDVARNEEQTMRRRAVQINRVRYKKQKLQKILSLITRSKDKLFFISRHKPGHIKGE
jgi:hypothetical protein